MKGTTRNGPCGLLNSTQRTNQVQIWEGLDRSIALLDSMSGGE